MSHLSATAIGHVGRADELKTLQSGKQVLRFSLACNTGYGERQKTQWVECSIFGDRAAKLAQFITKGKLLHVHGTPEIRQYTTKAGTAGVSLDLIVGDLTLLGGKTGNEHGNEQPPQDDGPNF